MGKAKNKMWFGCPNCKHEPPQDEKQSNENWNVFTSGKCPKCGTEMKLNFVSKET